MEGTDKVFFSNITRCKKSSKNNLSELVATVPVKPITPTLKNETKCGFQPNIDKIYIPKKKLKFYKNKVKTLRDVRNEFEKDVCSSLSSELEKQENALLQKIISGSSQTINTKAFAKKILKSQASLSRSAWQMIININPDNRKHSKQYIRLDKKYIRINGSKGGKHKVICSSDTSDDKFFLKANHTNVKAIKANLINSLHVKFNPGPLSKKKNLDISNQKYNFGNIRVINLPRSGLDIFTSYGKPLDSNFASFLNHLRGSDGKITEQWAELSVSVLGKIQNGKPIKVQNNTEAVTFNLEYNNLHNKLLMRSNKQEESCHVKSSQHNKPQKTVNKFEIQSVVTNIMKEMISCIEISLEEEKFVDYLSDDKHFTNDDSIIPSGNSSLNCKSKSKRKYSELEKLDVNKIKLDDSENNARECRESFCLLGCVCSSLNSGYVSHISHCGKITCMFQCLCHFSKKQRKSEFDSENSYDFLSIKNKFNLDKSNEENKFQQTVFVKENKSFLFYPKTQSNKFTRNSANIISDFSSNIEDYNKRSIAINLCKYDFSNIEPWCMVHNLYRCFCKGKFLEKVVGVGESNVKSALPLNIKKSDREKNIFPTTLIHKPQFDFVDSYEETTCARILPFVCKNHLDVYYNTLHKRMAELEKNDKSLYRKLKCITSKLDIKSDSKNISDSYNDEVINISSRSPSPCSMLAESSNVDYENCSRPNTLVKDTTNNKNPSLSISETDSLQPEKPVENKNKLITWIETSYKQYKERLNAGITKISLESPTPGKLALYPWNFISSRYRERKNLFLVSKTKPYRIYMAVNKSHPLFDQCMNIDDIRFNDLRNYPLTVRNLLTNVQDLKDNFCILCGLKHCWELIGSITKVSEKTENDPEYVENKDENLQFNILSSENVDGNSQLEVELQGDACEITTEPLRKLIKKSDITTSLKLSQAISIENKDEEDSPSQFQKTSIKLPLPISIENKDEENISSRWFVLTIENDFREIQFNRKGFFVKYESIIQAISVARKTNKTVRLSSQKCSENVFGPQFGIYAIPNSNESSVFVGPYANDEPLGIETIKTISDIKKKNRTKGIWITTDSLDNFKVINNPLSFIPKKGEGDVYIDFLNETCLESEKLNDAKGNPIKILKPKDLYRVSDISKNKIDRKFIRLNNPSVALNINKKTLLAPTNFKRTLEPMPQLSKPVAEIAPQVKAVPPESDKKNLVGMFVLRPDEINRRLDQNADQIDADIESFLATSAECTAPATECFIISDDEDALPDSKPVWIQCRTIKNLGWIPGKKDSKNLISFEFPGFRYTAFYEKQDAFKKINQVLSRKIYVPNYLHIEWDVIEESELKTEKIKAKDLSADLVLTKKGLKSKDDFNKTCVYILEERKRIIMPRIQNHMSLETASRAVMLLREGESQRSVALQLGVSRKGIRCAWERYQKTGSVARRRGLGSTRVQ